MRSPAVAIAWEFRQQHRWGLVALTGSMLILAAIKVVIVGPGQHITSDDSVAFAMAVAVPLTAGVLYCQAVFTFGLAGDLAARESIYPTRMFALPVTTAALAGWPMLYGTTAMVLLWLVVRPLMLWPAGFVVPLIWPALLAASLLAWTQALAWMPYPLRGMRAITTLACLCVIEAIAMIGLELKAPEPVMLAILVPLVPLAFLVARHAVGRARRGDVPDWRGSFSWLGRIADRLPRRPARFSSPAGAQLWFEWRRYGWSLPAMVAVVVPLELGLLFLFSDTKVIVFETLAVVLLTPAFMAAFVAATVSEASRGGGSASAAPFLATRPVSDAALIAAKLKATIWSTLAAWLLVVLAIALALRFSGTGAMVVDWGRNLTRFFGPVRAVTLALLGFAILLASTWKQLVQSLYIGLAGRGWAVKASTFVPLSLLAVGFPLVLWLLENRPVLAAVLNLLPWILAGLVCCKLAAGGWIAVRLRDSRLLSDRALILGAVCWDVTVLAIFGVLVWALPAILFRAYFLGLVAILTVPLARLSAAPLAVAWSRHR